MSTWQNQPACYWFWHRLPTDEEIDAQVADIAQGGFGSFQVQARHSFPVDEYLSERYLRQLRRAVDRARDHGLTVGFYDEYAWQSGQAGGRTVSGRDDLRERHAFPLILQPDEEQPGHYVGRLTDITTSAADLGGVGMAWAYDGGRMSWHDWRVVGAVHISAEPDSMGQVTDLIDRALIERFDDAGCHVSVTLPGLLAARGGQVVVCVAARSASSRIPNMLDPAALPRFWDVGVAPALAALGDHVGATVHYLFFDQPHPTYHHWPGMPDAPGALATSIPWHDDVPRELAARSGRTWPQLLAAAVADIGDDTARCRVAFYGAFTDLALDRWMAPLRERCDQAGLGLAGHEVLGHVGGWDLSAAFTDWDLRLPFGLDHARFDTYRTITAVDAQDPVPQLSVRLGQSMARTAGRRGCLVEQYIAGPTEGPTAWSGDWSLSLKTYRAQAIRLTLLGASQFLFHAYWQTDGWPDDDRLLVNPRWDFPPGVNFEPWWQLHRMVAGEVADLSRRFDALDVEVKVGLLWPRATIWAHGRAGGHARHLAEWARLLAEAGIDYAIVDERDIHDAAVDGADLHCAGHRLRAMILPNIRATERDLSPVLDAWRQGGGRAIASGVVASALSQTAELIDLPDTVEHVSRLCRAWAVGTAWEAQPEVWGRSGQMDGEQWACLFNASDERRELKVQLQERTGWIGLEPGQLRWVSAADLQHMPPDRTVSPSEEDQVLELPDGWLLRPPGGGPDIPIDPSRPWTEQGVLGSGIGTYSRHVDLSRPAELVVPAAHGCLRIRVDGVEVATWPTDRGRVHLPAAGPAAYLEIDVIGDAANGYREGSNLVPAISPGGLAAAPSLRIMSAAATKAESGPAGAGS